MGALKEGVKQCIVFGTIYVCFATVPPGWVYATYLIPITFHPYYLTGFKVAKLYSVASIRTSVVWPSVLSECLRRGCTVAN